MKPPVNRRPLLFVTLALMTGIFAGGLVSGNLLLTVILPTALAAVGLILLFGFKRSLLAAICLAFAFGTAIFNLDFALSFGGEAEGEYEVEARVESVKDGYFLADSLVFDGTEYKGKARVYYYGEVEEGRTVKLTGTVSTLEIDLFDTYSSSAFNDGIFYEITPESEMVVGERKFTFLEKVKKRITDPMYEYMSAEDAGIAAALVLGDKGGLTAEDSETVRGIGMSHVFAVSGLHVGFLMGIVLFIAKLLKLRPFPTIVFSAVFLLLYGFVTGFPAGIKRAAIMSLLYMAAPLFRRKSDNVTTLSAACFAILVTNPTELFDIGFIMSVSAVAGIILFYKPIYSFLAGKTPSVVRKKLSQALALTVSANVLLLPVCFNVFNTFAIYMAISNLLILPLVTVAYTMLTAAALVTVIFPFAGFLYYPSQFPLMTVRVLSKALYSLPYAVLNVQSLGVLTAFYIFAAVVLCRLVKYPNYVKSGIVSAASLVSLVTVLLI